MNRFAILGAMGVAVIVAALVLNYAINNEEVGESSAPAPAATAPAGSSGQTGQAATGQAATGTGGGGSQTQASTAAGGTAAGAPPAAGSSAPAPATISGVAGAPAAASVPAQQPTAPAESSGSSAGTALAVPGAGTVPSSSGAATGSTASGTGTNVASAGSAATGPGAPPPIKPTFDIVRVNPDGSTVIAGRAAPRSVVTLTADGQKLGTVEADDRGEWVLVPGSRLPPGNHQIAIASQLGNAPPVESDDIVVVVVPQPQVATGGQSSGGTQTALAQPQQPLAVVVPRTDQGSTVLQAPNPPQSGLLVLQSVDYDSDGRLVIGGQAPPGKEVRGYLDNQLLGVAQADSSGRWHIKPEGAVPPGLHSLRIDQVEQDGKVVARVESPFARAEPLTIAAGDQVVVVQPGNSLWLIATRTYGSGFRYTVIYQANKMHIKNPDLIYPGQVFKLPTTATP